MWPARTADRLRHRERVICGLPPERPPRSRTSRATRLSLDAVQYLIFLLADSAGQDAPSQCDQVWLEPAVPGGPLDEKYDTPKVSADC